MLYFKYTIVDSRQQIVDVDVDGEGDVAVAVVVVVVIVKSIDNNNLAITPI